MSEVMKKKKLTFNQDALDILALQYGVSRDYIRKSLRGDRVGTNPDLLKKEYPLIVEKLKQSKEKIAQSPK